MVARNILTRPPRRSTLPQAAQKVVDDLRRSGPSTWKELWKAGVGDSVLPPQQPPQLLPGQSKSRKFNAHLKGSILGQAPEDHPYGSVTHFKKHILKNLAQQGLIEQVHIARPTSASASTSASSPSSASSSSSGDPLQDLRKSLVEQKQLPSSNRAGAAQLKEKAHGHLTSEFLWTLPRALAAPESALAADERLKAQRERLESDLQRLASAQDNHDLVHIGRARTQRLAAEAASRREHQVSRRAVLPGTNGERAYRTRDEMMVWGGRKENLTVEKERDHLNKRKALGRPMKERRAQSWLDELNEAREEARNISEVKQ